MYFRVTEVGVSMVKGSMSLTEWGPRHGQFSRAALMAEAKADPNKTTRQEPSLAPAFVKFKIGKY